MVPLSLFDMRELYILEIDALIILFENIWKDEIEVVIKTG